MAALLLGVLGAGSAWSQPSQVDPPARPDIPDLNRLQQRVLDFWSLVTRKQKHQALSYVAEGQDHFLNWNWPPVQSYRVEKLELEQQSQEAVVTMRTVVHPPSFPAAVNWPVRQRWVWREGTWMIRVPASNLAAVFGAKRPKPAAASSPDRTENLKQLRKFRIGKRRVQFGQVPQGEASWRQIPYHNESGIEIGLRVIESPSWIALDRSYFRAQPGEEGTLLLGVFTEQLEGEIKGTLTLELVHGEASQTQTISVQGSVQTPLSAAPGRLVLAPGVSHEIVVHNRGREEIRIAEIVSPVDFITAEWATGESAQIAPDGRSILKVQWDAERTPEDWAGGVLRLRLSGPGQRELTIPLLRKFP